MNTRKHGTTPGEKDPLNFSSYVAIDVNKGLREGYIDSFQSFMESLIRSARSKVTVQVEHVCFRFYEIGHKFGSHHNAISGQFFEMLAH